MAKTLLLIRHAKSSWDSGAESDFDRPLNERGKKDAPRMAKRLRSRGQSIDFFVSSPAKRARRTAELFMEEYEKSEKKLLLLPELYHATPRDFSECIRSLDNAYGSVAIFSHNPGITAFASSLTEVRIDNMPTGSVFAVRLDATSWSAFSESEKHFLFFDYPKAEP